MGVLNRQELSDLNPEKIYSIGTFVLHPELWAKIDKKFVKILNNPIKIKFNDQIRTKLGKLKDKKGIYIFFIEPNFPFVPATSYLMYVGRVISNNTFHKRFYDYVSAIGSRTHRRNIQLLTNLWPDKTWVYFYDLSVNDQEIAKIEEILYNNICPPLNTQFRSKRALNSRSIYN